MVNKQTPLRIFTYADEAITQMVLDNLVISMGHEALPQTSLSQLTESLLSAPHEAHQPPVAVIDITFWEEFAEAASSFPSFEGTMVFIGVEPSILSQWSASGLAEPLPKNGAFEFLPKPLSENLLKKALPFWLQQETISDASALNKWVGSGDDDLTKKIVASYQTSLDEALEKTKDALSRDHIGDLVKATHAIKASSQIVGAKRIHQLCLWIEAKAQIQSPFSPFFKKIILMNLEETLTFYKQIGTHQGH